MNIASVSRIVVLSVLVIAGLSACRLPVTTKPKELYCPVPLQNCKPGQWEGIPFDTMSTTPNTTRFYLKIEPVYLLNSPRDEWGLSFYSPKEAVQTLSTDSGVQYMRAVKFRAPEIASIDNDLPVMIKGSAGGLSVRATTSVFSILPENNLPGDASIVQADFTARSLENVAVIPSPVSNTIDWDAQPSLTPDGNVMFFASDRKGGVGGTDIWFTVRRNGSWSSPINCGENINSRCDELTPFVTSDGRRLLFASAGHETVGGYDIFTAEILPSMAEFIRSGAEQLPTNFVLFSQPRNYGMPLNTKYDELFPSSPAGTDTLLYYSSNQPASTAVSAQQKGKFDMYVLHQLAYPKESTRLAEKESSKRERPRGKDSQTSDIPRTKTKIDGKVINLATKKPVENADVTVRELPSQEVVDKTTTDKDGNYSVTVPTMTDLEISAQNEDLFYDSHKIRLNPNDTLIKLTQNFALPDKLFLRINFPSDVFDNPYQYVLDSNGAETNQTYTEALDLLAQNLVNFKDKIKKLILIGHTDEVASDAYNLALGKRRVEFVATELIKRGVSKAMLDTKSAGESQPLLQRTGEDLEVYRKRLRRVELQKIMR